MCSMQKKLLQMLPHFVKAHDDILEDEPLHDYGYVSSTENLAISGLPPGGLI